MPSIPLILSDNHSCSYFNNRTARSVFVDPFYNPSSSNYEQLIALGFRRSGEQIYNPHCASCHDCIPVRIPVDQFIASRSQQRNLKKNQMLDAAIKPPVFSQSHYDLYRCYQRSRHPGSTMAESTPEEYMNFLTSNWCETVFVEFTLQNKIAAVAIVDQLDNALSAVYTFFDPAFSHLGLGNYSVLWQIEQARQTNREWLYLGYWLEHCKKMSYKNQYRPIQAFIQRKWQIFAKGQTINY